MISENTKQRNEMRNSITEITRTPDWDGKKREPREGEVKEYHAKLKEIAQNLYKHNIDNMMQGNASSTQPGIKLIKKYVWQLADEIEALLEGVKGVSNLKPLVQYAALQPVSNREDISSRSKELAFMALTTIVNLSLNVSDKNIQGSPYSLVCKMIGKQLVQTMLDDYKRQENRIAYENKRAIASGEKLRKYKPKSLDAIKKEILGRKAWSDEDQARKELEVKSGAVVFNLVHDLIDLVEVNKRRLSKGSRWFRNVEVVAEHIDNVREMVSNNISNIQYYSPDISKPREWNNVRRNGKPLVRNSKYNKYVEGIKEDHIAKIDRDLHEKEAMPEVYEVLDIIESTEWTVDTSMIKIINECIEKGIQVPGINEKVSIPVHPPKVGDFKVDHEGEEFQYDEEEFKKACEEYRQENPSLFEEGEIYFEKEDTELVKAWKKRYKKKVSNDSKCAAGIRSIETAKALQEYEKIYFAHNLDTRGRIYPIATSLNPQLNDVSKGLLKFAEGDLVDEEALGWLEVNIANNWAEEVEIELTDEEMLNEIDFIRQFV